MKSSIFSTTFISLLLFVNTTYSSAQSHLINTEIELRIDSLLQIMTTYEKVGQLNQHSGSWDITGPMPEEGHSKKRYDLVKNGGVGSMLNVVGAERTYAAQKLAVEGSRLGIPLLFGYDVIHGFKTMFPIPLGETASWDLDAMEISARVAAIEAAAAGLHWTFAPMIDIGRDARWGRVMEGAGEDPYLTSLAGVARIKGFQTDDLSKINTIAATAKHFAGYGFAEAGREYNTVEINRNTLLNVVLPPFKAASDAGVASFMNAFNDILGIPATASSYLQRDILKEEWGFNGLVVSDWGSIKEFITHGYAKDLKSSAKIALQTGNDIDMESDAYQNHMVELVENGTVDESLLDDAVRRVLRIKFLLGLFDDPYKYSDIQREKEMIYTKEHRQIARDVAKKSIVLLENKNNLLPLDKKTKKIAVIGSLAADKDSPLGSWRARAEANSAVSLLEGIQNAVSRRTKVEFAQGYVLAEGRRAFVHELTFAQDNGDGFEEAISKAKNADVVVMAVGEEGFQSGEARSQVNIDLIGRQLELLQKVYEVNQNIVVVLMNGRPIAEPWLYENIPAILEAWHLGSEAGNAIADVLFGDYNPAGKLPVSIPRSVGQAPIYYNKKSTGRPGQDAGDASVVFWSHYTDSPNSPQYPFGYGLSYTSFRYDEPQLSAATMRQDETVELSVTVTNTGKVSGEEVVQFYIHDHFATTIRPIKELKGFKKVSLQPNQSETVVFTISEETLAFFGADEKFKAEPGTFTFMVGTDSANLQSVEFELLD